MVYTPIKLQDISHTATATFAIFQPRTRLITRKKNKRFPSTALAARTPPRKSVVQVIEHNPHTQKTVYSNNGSPIFSFHFFKHACSRKLAKASNPTIRMIDIVYMLESEVSLPILSSGMTATASRKASAGK